MKLPDYKSRKGKPVTVCVSMTDRERAKLKKLAKASHGGNVSYYIRAMTIDAH